VGEGEGEEGAGGEYRVPCGARLWGRRLSSLHSPPLLRRLRAGGLLRQRTGRANHSDPPSTAPCSTPIAHEHGCRRPGRKLPGGASQRFWAGQRGCKHGKSRASPAEGIPEQPLRGLSFGPCQLAGGHRAAPRRRPPPQQLPRGMPFQVPGEGSLPSQQVLGPLQEEFPSHPF